MSAAAEPLSAVQTYPAIQAYGTMVQVRTSGPGVTPETYQVISGVGDITGPANSLGEVETTSHSTGAPIKTFLPALIDLGDLSFPCYWNPQDPTQSASSTFGAEYLFFNRIQTKFQLVLPDETHYTRQFPGYIKSMGEDYKLNGICTRNIAIRIMGQWVNVPPAIAVTPATASVPGTGTTAPQTVQVTAGGLQTSWTPLADVPWITVTAPTAPTVGDAAITYTVAAQAVSAPARTGHIMVAALQLTFTINQAAG